VKIGGQKSLFSFRSWNPYTKNVTFSPTFITRQRTYQVARRFQYVALNWDALNTGAAKNSPPARNASANVLRAAARGVKPAGKRSYRTSSADCAAPS
jgi:hypothetical protein